MTSFATAGEVAEGDELTGGVPSGVDEGLVSGLEAGVDGLVSGGFEVSLGGAQAASTKAANTNNVAETAPHLSLP